MCWGQVSKQLHFSALPISADLQQERFFAASPPEREASFGSVLRDVLAEHILLHQRSCACHNN